MMAVFIINYLNLHQCNSMSWAVASVRNRPIFHFATLFRPVGALSELVKRAAAVPARGAGVDGVRPAAPAAARRPPPCAAAAGRIGPRARLPPSLSERKKLNGK